MLIRAAGAVTWRPGPDGAEILLVHRAKYDDWSLPKGKVQPGEPLPVTATREVGEEGGATITLGRRLGPARYKVNGNPKQVDWWAARATAVDAGAVPNDEVDQVAWLPLERALKQVSYKQDVSALSDFAARPVDTVPLILLRHAKALPRSEWKKDDIDRPLNKVGLADAAALARLLSCFVPRTQVITSPAARCVDTVRPYAELSGSQVQSVEALSPSALGPTKPADSYTLVSTLVASDTPAIVCAHRENLPALLDVALTAAGAVAPERAESAQGSGKRPAERNGSASRVPASVAKPLSKGAFLVLHLASGTLAGIDRYEAG